LPGDAARVVDVAMQLKKPATEKFHKRREMIIRAAIDVMNRRGVRGMTLADVARRLELVAPAVMYYFKSKEQLAATLYYRAIERYEQLIAAAQDAPSASEALEIFVRGYFDFRAAESNGEAEPIALFNDIRALHDPGVGEAYIRMFRNARALLLKPGMPPGLERIDHNARTHLLLSQLAWAVVWLPRYYTDDYRRLADHTLDILENGLLPPDGPWRSPTLQVGPVEDKDSAARETFLQAATLLVNERGYLGASVQKISEHLNLTKGAFYHHLDNKDDLIVACFRRTLDILKRTLSDAGQVAKNGAEHLIAASTALVEYQAGGSTPLLRTSALTSVPEEIGTKLVAEFDRTSGRVSLALTDGITDGSLRSVDANIGSQMITAMINAGAEVHAWAPGLTQQNVAKVYVRPMFEGLLRSRSDN
jgi:AcrR family transcriptional regulator